MTSMEARVTLLIVPGNGIALCWIVHENDDCRTTGPSTQNQRIMRFVFGENVLLARTFAVSVVACGRPKPLLALAFDARWSAQVTDAYRIQSTNISTNTRAIQGTSVYIVPSTTRMLMEGGKHLQAHKSSHTLALLRT